MRKKLAVLFVLAALGSMFMHVAPAQADSTVNLYDDWQVRPGAFTELVKDKLPGPSLPVVGQPVDGTQVGKSPKDLPNHCDTIDPYLTTNAQNVSYRCAPQARIQTASVSSNDAKKYLTASWTLDGALPHVGELFNTADPNSQAQGWLFDIRFRTNWMDARRVVGDTNDCLRYAHAGPYLAGDKNLSTGSTVPGNDEWMSLWVQVIADDLVSYRVQYGWSHFGPSSLGDYLTVARPAGDATRCNGSTAESFHFAGTGANTPGATMTHAGECADAPVGCSYSFTSPKDSEVFSLQHRKITIKVPMNFEYVDNQHHYYKVPIIAPGAKMWDISATSTTLINCASTPDVSAGGTQVVGPQGIQCGALLDWIPWKSYNLGTYPDQTGLAQSVPESLYSASCPYFEVTEYTPGQARVDKPSGYLNLGKDPSTGADNEVQANPGYVDKSGNIPATPLSNYDAGYYAPDNSSHQPTKSVYPQGRKGSTQCDIPIDGAQKQNANFGNNMIV
ncbi:MAG: hypothetical protein NVSMB57_09600 [Actinomycetota bacterium]